MRVSRRVDQTVDKLVEFVKTEVARHPDVSPRNYYVSLTTGFEKGLPFAVARVAASSKPRDYFATERFYLGFSLCRSHAESRIADVVMRACERMNDTGRAGGFDVYCDAEVA